MREYVYPFSVNPGFSLVDAVLATWLRDQRRLQKLVGDWIDKSRNEQAKP
jgi:hypothetical protein